MLWSYGKIASGNVVQPMFVRQKVNSSKSHVTSISLYGNEFWPISLQMNRTL